MSDKANRTGAAERGPLVAGLNWSGIVVAFALVLIPIPSIYWLLIVPPIPILAMWAVARSKGRLKLLSTKKQRNGVDLVVLLVPMFMVLRGMRDFDLLDWAADCIGVIIAFWIIIRILKFFEKKKLHSE